MVEKEDIGGYIDGRGQSSKAITHRGRKFSRF